MKWLKIRKTENEEGTTIVYKCPDIEGITIESRKRHIPHSGREGFWDHTTFFIMKDGQEIKEVYSLSDAKRIVENMVESGTTLKKDTLGI